MSRQISESDWKKLQMIRPLALQRFCERTLSMLKEQLHDEEKWRDAHEVYLQIYQSVAEEDKKLSLLFDDWRRSTVHITLMGWLSAGLMTESEFNSLSDETKSWTLHLIDIEFYPST